MRTDRMIWFTILIGIGVWAYLFIAWNPWSNNDKENSAKSKNPSLTMEMLASDSSDTFEPAEVWVEMDKGVIPPQLLSPIEDPHDLESARSSEQKKITSQIKQEFNKFNNGMTVWFGRETSKESKPKKATNQNDTSKNIASLNVAPKAPTMLNSRQPIRYHRVVKGDTLSVISKKYLGTSSKWRKIFEKNKLVLKDPAKLKVGINLIIPETNSTNGQNKISPQQNKTSSQQISKLSKRASTKMLDIQYFSPEKTYVVARGDTLSSISKQFYGSVKKWKRILAANRRIVKSPNALHIGAKIQIP